MTFQDALKEFETIIGSLPEVHRSTCEWFFTRGEMADFEKRVKALKERQK